MKPLSIFATICIPVSRPNKTLESCLKKLEVQPVKKFQILLVTKHVQKTKKIARLFPSLSIKISKQKGTGLVGAMNTGLELCRSPIFIRIDDDTEVEKGWFEGITHPFVNEKIGGVTGPTVIPENRKNNRDVISVLTYLDTSNSILVKPLKWFFLSFLYEDKWKEIGKIFKSGTFSFGTNFSQSKKKPGQTVSYLEPSNSAFRTKALRSIGGFDNNFNKGLSEYHELDVCMKLTQNKWKLVFTPKASTFHCVSPTGLRPDAENRLKNFIMWYTKYIGFPDFSHRIRFLANIFTQLLYYSINAVRLHDLSQLKVWNIIFSKFF